MTAPARVGHLSARTLRGAGAGCRPTPSRCPRRRSSADSATRASADSRSSTGCSCRIAQVLLDVELHASHAARSMIDEAAISESNAMAYDVAIISSSVVRQARAGNRERQAGLQLCAQAQRQRSHGGRGAPSVTASRRPQKCSGEGRCSLQHPRRHAQHDHLRAVLHTIGMRRGVVAQGEIARPAVWASLAVLAQRAGAFELHDQGVAVAVPAATSSASVVDGAAAARQAREAQRGRASPSLDRRRRSAQGRWARVPARSNCAQ